MVKINEKYNIHYDNSHCVIVTYNSWDGEHLQSTVDASCEFTPDTNVANVIDVLIRICEEKIPHEECMTTGYGDYVAVPTI